MGNEELFEETVEDPVISLGHRGDQVIQLLDPHAAPEHAVLKPGRKGRFEFKALGTARCVVGGRSRKRGRLQIGDTLEVGSQTVRVVEPPGGFDGALEVVLIEGDEAIGPATHFRTELSQTGLGTRRLAWLLVLGIPILFLGIPLAGYFSPDLGTRLREQPVLPSDHVWLSGPLSNVHRIPEIGADCNACHRALFERTPDNACMECHERIPGHVDKAHVSVPILEARRCASCHKEHNEPPMLVRDDDRLCLACHRAPERFATSLQDANKPLPEPVDGFSRETHPRFRLTMLRQTGPAGKWESHRVAYSEFETKEQSHLEFPHDLHLDPDEVESLQSGEALTCGSCHELEDGGEHFRPITMERDCRECHSLAFDEDFPNKQLPHGDVAAAVIALQEHFIRKFADPGLRTSAGVRRRRPGGAGRDTESCEGSALECGRRSALREATSQFTRSGCVTCHDVQERPERGMLERWHVQEVRLTSDWYPYARFDHVSHLTQKGAAQDPGEACKACHGAADSEKSAEILIPGRDNCTECHQTPGRGQAVALSCRGCHGFHLPGRGPMRAGERPQGGAGEARASRDP